MSRVSHFLFERNVTCRAVGVGAQPRSGSNLNREIAIISCNFGFSGLREGFCGHLESKTNLLHKRRHHKCLQNSPKQKFKRSSIKVESNLQKKKNPISVVTAHFSIAASPHKLQRQIARSFPHSLILVSVPKIKSKIGRSKKNAFWRAQFGCGDHVIVTLLQG